MKILGIESTCDETSVAIVEDGKKLLSNVVASSSLMHEKYGGVVPEIAAREQIKVIIPTLAEALYQAKASKFDIDAIAISYGPGLLGSLIIGVETAKVLALAWKKPLIATNHLMGHIYANWLTENSKTPEFPLVALVVSGGHSDLIFMENQKTYKWLGGTKDDSAGEAFDKVARLLGLAYPGGPEIERVATKTSKDTEELRLPRPLVGSHDFDFSFSGLKTAVVYMVRDKKLDDKFVSTVAYEFQNAVCDVLTKKTISAAKKFDVKTVVVGGGVAANTRLRVLMKERTKENSFELFFPEKKLSIDNGAMIAAAAFYQQNFIDPLKLQPTPGLFF